MTGNKVPDKITGDKVPDKMTGDKVPDYTSQPAPGPTQEKPYVRETVSFPPQEKQPIQQQPIPQHYVPQATAPLNSLNMSSAIVDCPVCGSRSHTRIDFVAGSQTQYISPRSTLMNQCLGDFAVLIHRPRMSSIYRQPYQRRRT